MSTPTSAPPVIDAHHHLWDLAVRDQEWTRDLPALHRSFGFAELEPQLAACGVTGTVLVQTVPIADETTEFLALAARHARIAGVVGWVDLTCDDVADELRRLRAVPGGEYLVGIRHLVQGEPDPRWLVRDDVLRGLRAVATVGLAYDLLVLPHQLPAAAQAARLVPQLRLVLDHLGKPLIASGVRDPWADDLARLAEQPNVACKLSGLVTEAAEQWSPEQLAPYATHALAVFGPDRVMLGSDWPVCLLRADYAEVTRVYRDLVAHLPAVDRERVRGRNAVAWYGLSDQR